MSPIVPGRTCGTCSLCCILPDIDALSKPANAVCRHCVPGQGCRIYADRPKLCADFQCRWIEDALLPPEWEPARAHMMVYEQGRQITVLVDPAHPDVWRHAPYHDQLMQWAIEADPLGGFVIVFVGDAAIKIEPGYSRQ